MHLLPQRDNESQRLDCLAVVDPSGTLMLQMDPEANWWLSAVIGPRVIMLLVVAIWTFSPSSPMLGVPRYLVKILIRERKCSRATLLFSSMPRK